MVFKCQEDSFLKEFQGKVILCEKVSDAENGICVPETLEADGEKFLFKVILDETILFPEGGGQPCDYGSLNDRPCQRVVRDGDQAVHFIESSSAKPPFKVGEMVQEKINWNRRQDHMQQHSGQHLITAIFDREYGWDTRSWWLGTESSYIQLNAKDVTSEQMENVERICNELIAEGRQVSVTVVDKEKGIEFTDMRAPRGLPSDHIGPVRIVTIHGIESNMCCGTHVTNLCQLQCVKLLYLEKAKNKLYCHFLVGNRAIKKLDECYKREQQLNTVLKGGPSTHLDLIQKSQINLRTINKATQKLLKEIAEFQARTVASENAGSPKYLCLHREDYGIETGDFVSAFLRKAPSETFYFLTFRDQNGGGNVVLKGDPNAIKIFGPEFMIKLDGQGNGKGNMFQGKVNSFKKLQECENSLRDFFDATENSQ